MSARPSKLIGAWAPVADPIIYTNNILLAGLIHILARMAFQVKASIWMKNYK